ncbi:unnamed protein product [Ixodes hexagonus]
MPRNGNILVVESVLSPGNSTVLGKTAEVEDLVSAIKENLKLKSQQQPCNVCGQQRHPRYSPYLIPKRTEAGGVVPAVPKDVVRRTCANHHQQDADKDPYEMLQDLLREGTLIQEAVRRLQENVVGKTKAPHSLDSSSRDSFSF